MERPVGNSNEQDSTGPQQTHGLLQERSRVGDVLQQVEHRDGVKRGAGVGGRHEMAAADVFKPEGVAGIYNANLGHIDPEALPPPSLSRSEKYTVSATDIEQAPDAPNELSEIVQSACYQVLAAVSMCRIPGDVCVTKVMNILIHLKVWLWIHVDETTTRATANLVVVVDPDRPSGCATAEIARNLDPPSQANTVVARSQAFGCGLR